MTKSVIRGVGIESAIIGETGCEEEEKLEGSVGHDYFPCAILVDETVEDSWL